MGKVIGTEKKVDLAALVNAVHSVCKVEVDFPELTEKELEVMHPFLL